MHTWLRWMVMGSIWASSLAAGAGAFDAARIPAGVQWVAHLDAARLRDSAVGEVILESLRAEEAERKFAAFDAVFGFDPRRDIEAVTLFGFDGEEANSGMIVDADVDRDRLLTLLQANDSYTTMDHAGKTVHAWIDRDKGDTVYTYGTFIDEDTVIVSKNRGLVEGTLDAVGGTGASLADGEGPMPIPGGSSFLAAGASLAAMGESRPKAAVIDNASWLMLSLGQEGDQVVGQAELGAADRATAEQIQSVARGMLALAQLGRQDNPALADLAGSAAVDLEDRVVRLRISVPAAEAADHVRREIRKQQDPDAAAAPAAAGTD